MELPNEINDEEFLYRRIINKPNFWKEELNRHTSAAFKQSNGLSVDRSNFRPESDVIDVYKNLEIKAVVNIKCQDCREIPTNPKHMPIPDNIFHSEIHNSNSEVNLTSKQIKILSEKSNPIWIKSDEI